MKKSFYVDSCIYLNLWLKEGDKSLGKPYWEIASDFLDFVDKSDDCELISSNFVLKEIESRLNNFNVSRMDYIKTKSRFVKATEKDYNFARKLESEMSYAISFYDCLHISLCKRLGFILVTRDKDLIKIAKRHVWVSKPENLL